MFRFLVFKVPYNYRNMPRPRDFSHLRDGIRRLGCDFQFVRPSGELESCRLSGLSHSPYMQVQVRSPNHKSCTPTECLVRRQDGRRLRRPYNRWFSSQTKIPCSRRVLHVYLLMYICICMSARRWVQKHGLLFPWWGPNVAVCRWCVTFR
jgi:hypothetical protein